MVRWVTFHYWFLIGIRLAVGTYLLLFLLQGPQFPVSFRLSQDFQISSTARFSLQFSLSISFPLRFSFFPIQLMFSFSTESKIAFPTQPRLAFSAKFRFSFPAEFVFFSFPRLEHLFSFHLFLFFSYFFLALRLLMFSIGSFVFTRFAFR